MTAFLKRLWAAAPVATLILALALTAVLVFGVRSALFWGHRHERIAREQPVAAWMTPGYVAHSWRVPRELVIEALALERRDGPRRAPLADIAADRGVPVEELIDALEQAIAAHRAAHPGTDAREERSDEPAQGDERSDEPPDQGERGQ